MTQQLQTIMSTISTTTANIQDKENQLNQHLPVNDDEKEQEEVLPPPQNLRKEDVFFLRDISTSIKMKENKRSLVGTQSTPPAFKNNFDSPVLDTTTIKVIDALSDAHVYDHQKRILASTALPGSTTGTVRGSIDKILLQIKLATK